MATTMPKEISDLLNQLDDPEEVIRISSKWNEYVTANENYERNYPQQFANQVKGNQEFKEQKSIPTPAEQLRMYEGMVVQELHDIIGEKETAKEEVYEIEEQDLPESSSPLGMEQESPQDKMKGFKLTFDDMGKEEQGDKTTELDIKTIGRDIDQSQELWVTWIKEYKEQQAIEQGTDKDVTEPEKGGNATQDLKLTFRSLDELEKDDLDIQPEQGQDRDDWDKEYE